MMMIDGSTYLKDFGYVAMTRCRTAQLCFSIRPSHPSKQVCIYFLHFLPPKSNDENPSIVILSLTLAVVFGYFSLLECASDFTLGLDETIIFSLKDLNPLLMLQVISMKQELIVR